MMNFFRKHMRAIFIVTMITFLGGIFLGAGSYLFNKSSDFAAKINGTKIPMNLFYSIYKSSVKSYQQTTNKSLDEKELNEIKVRVIQILVQTELLCQEAKKYGIIVTDEELKSDLQNSLEFKDGDSFNILKYTAFLNTIQMKPKDYENLRKKQLMANKVKMIMASSVKLWNYEVESISKQNPPVHKNDLFFTKVNVILTEWHDGAIRNSNLISNDIIFKVV
ncbi:MAG: SurA N-terminal domain-containing protein [Endomicrobium sp.]|nr:SurA N-terminal domain-containing protein [Endomicrobium sp.]